MAVRTAHKKGVKRVAINLAGTASVFALAFVGACGHSRAQTAPPAPIRPTVDANGVDLFNAWLDVESPGLSVGGVGSSLGYHAWSQGAGFDDSYRAFLSLSGSTMTVNIGEVSDAFTVSAGTYSSATGDGAMLTFNSSANIYTFTGRDGTVAHFNGAQANTWNSYGGVALATDITKPNGEKITYTWYSTAYCTMWKVLSSGQICLTKAYMYRISSINSSNGFQITPVYNYNYTLNYSAPNFQAWSTANSINLYNFAISTTVPVQSLAQSDTVIGNYVYRIVTDPMGKQWKYRYLFNNTAQVAGITPPASGSETVTAVYSYINNNEILTSITNAHGTTTYARSTSGNVLTVTATDALTHVSTYTFDLTTGQMLSYTDPLMNKTTNVIDSYGRITQVTLPEGGITKYSYDGRGNVYQVTKVPKPGSLLSNIVLNSSFDATCTNAVKCNQPNWTQDGLTNETDYTYDSTTGLLTSVTLPAPSYGTVRPQTRYYYTPLQGYFLNGSGSIVASGVNTYLLTGTSSCQTQAGATVVGMQGGTGQFSLSGAAACAGTADEVKQTISYGPQTAGTANNLWPVSQTVAAGDSSVSASSSQTYDSLGNIASSTGPLGAGQTSYRFYDANRRLIGTIAPDPDSTGPRTPAATQFSYNDDGALTTQSVGTVPNQATALSGFVESSHVTATVDTFDRPVRISTVSSSTTYAVADQLYDSLGRPWCSVTYMNPANVPASSATTCTAYQSSGPYGPDRIAQQTFDADSRALVTSDGIGVLGTITGYNPDGTIQAVLDGQNNKTSYTWDGFNRVVQANYPVATQGANSSDPGNYDAVTSYDADDHALVQHLRDGNTITYTYDNLGRVATRTPGGTAALSSNDYPVTYTYNLLNAVTQIARANDGQTLTNHYDALGRLTSEGQPFGTATYQYDAAGDRTRITWGDGFYASYNYDYIGAVTSIAANGATSGVGVLATYSYDNLGRRSAVAYGNGTSRTYAYDGINRLAGAQLSFPTSANNDLIGGVGGQGTPISYTPSSQIAGITRSNDAYAWTGAYNVSRTYTANGLNQYTSTSGATIGYDARGNLASSTPTTGTANTYSYTKLNELFSVGPSVATLYYDPLSRLSEYDTTGSTRFYYSNAQVVAEVANPSGTVTQRYVPGPEADEVVAWYAGSGNTSSPQFLQTDERGSVIAITNTAGSLVAANTYDEFGIPGPGNVGRFGFTGQTWFPEIGLYNFKARWYSPSLGRFMQTDPIGYGDGLNWYNFVHVDPVNGSDPTGLDDCNDGSGEICVTHKPPKMSGGDRTFPIGGTNVPLPNPGSGGASRGGLPASSPPKPTSNPPQNAPFTCAQAAAQPGKIQANGVSVTLTGLIGWTATIGTWTNLQTGAHGSFTTVGFTAGLAVGASIGRQTYSSMDAFTGMSDGYTVGASIGYGPVGVGGSYSSSSNSSGSGSGGNFDVGSAELPFVGFAASYTETNISNCQAGKR